MSVVAKFLDGLFPDRRLDLDFPLAVWFAGLWLYLKSFLYLCYLYMIGTDEQSFTPLLTVEVGYFLMAFVPALLLACALWNEKKGAVGWALAFLVVDTPVLVLHIFRLSMEGFLAPGLTKVLEFGSLGLNMICLVWLGQYVATRKSGGQDRRAHQSR